MMINKTLPFFGLTLLLVTGLSIASIAAYESIVGLADLFAARQDVVIIMAVLIEWGKLMFAGTLHMFWRTLPWWKWLGVFIVLIHMAVTNIGIYSFLTSGYLLQEAPVAALERQVVDVDRVIAQYATKEQEAIQKLEEMNTAYRVLVEKAYVTRAEKYERQNAEKRADYEAERDAARTEIVRLQKERAKMLEDKADNSAKLGSIEHLAAFTSGDKEDIMFVLGWFTILLMLGLDPAAVLMVILFTHLLSKVVRRVSQPVEKLVLEPAKKPDNKPASQPALPVVEDTIPEVETPMESSSNIGEGMEKEPALQPAPEPAKKPVTNLSDLPKEVTDEMQRLNDIGFIKNRIKGKQT